MELGSTHFESGKFKGQLRNYWQKKRVRGSRAVDHTHQPKKMRVSQKGLYLISKMFFFQPDFQGTVWALLRPCSDPESLVPYNYLLIVSMMYQ